MGVMLRTLHLFNEYLDKNGKVMSWVDMAAADITE